MSSNISPISLQLQHYEITQNEFKINHQPITEYLLLNQQNKHYNLLIYSTWNWREDLLNHPMLVEREQSLNNRMYFADTLKVSSDDDGGKVILSTIFYSEEVLRKLLTLNSLTKEDKNILSCFAIYLHENQCTQINRHHISELKRLSRIAYTTEDITSSLEKCYLVLNQQENYQFAMALCKDYFLAKQFVQYEQTNYIGQFTQAIGGYAYNQITQAKHPNSFKTQFEGLQAIRTAKHKAIVQQQYEQAANLRTKEVHYFNQSIVQHWNKYNQSIWNKA